MLLDLSLPLGGVRLETAADDPRLAELMAKGHVGTHLDRVLGTTVPLDYFKSRGVMFEVSGFSGEREVGLTDLEPALVRPGDFVFFHSGNLERHGYGSQAYMAARFELSWEVIEFLLERRVRFIGVDARGIRMGAEHHQADQHCEAAGTYVIENLNQLGLLPAGEAFMAYAVCFDTGTTGVPCQVLAETIEG